jgi:cytochrome c5
MIIPAKVAICGTLILGAAIAVLAQAPAKATPKPAAKPTSAAKTAPPQNPGELAFQHNCSRCHYAPEELNPHITGTVVRHMRVRANLSAEDERLILSYFSP